MATKKKISSTKVIENDILEFIQGFAGSRVPIIDSQEYSVILGNHRLDGLVTVAKMSQNSTDNFFDQLNDMFFAKFSRTIDVQGLNIFVSEVI